MRFIVHKNNQIHTAFIQNHGPFLASRPAGITVLFFFFIKSSTFITSKYKPKRHCFDFYVSFIGASIHPCYLSSPLSLQFLIYSPDFSHTPRPPLLLFPLILTDCPLFWPHVVFYHRMTKLPSANTGEATLHKMLSP